MSYIARCDRCGDDQEFQSVANAYHNRVVINAGENRLNLWQPSLAMVCPRCFKLLKRWLGVDEKENASAECAAEPSK